MPSSEKKPVSEKQLAANRANAAKSTGPKSAAGLARSSRNARKHGLASENYTVVRLEDIDEVARLRADIVAARADPPVCAGPPGPAQLGPRNPASGPCSGP